MGRLNRRSPARRGRLTRSLLLFAVLLLGPAAGFSILGWNSVVHQHDFRVQGMHSEASDLLMRRIHGAVADLDLLRRKEAARDYYEYQERFMPRGQTGDALLFQDSDLARAPADPRVLGWFQWELYSGKAYGKPQVLPRENDEFRRMLALAYGAAFEERLLRAPRNETLREGDGRSESYEHRQVAANEERGKLEEEIESQGGPTRLRRDFQRRVEEALIGRSQALIRVRYTPFRYLAKPRGVPGPPLVAWRLVWIPNEQQQWREVKRDRYLIQGYALDPGIQFPIRWERIGTSELCRGDHVGSMEGRGYSIHSLAIVLEADLAGGSGRGRQVPQTFALSLSLAARADMAVARAAWVNSRNRYVLLIAGLIVVVGVGFTVLVRGVRRELALVRRKEDFMAAITHELKTPLTGIRMYADMLREGWVQNPAAADTYAGRILDETERLGHLVDQVLDLAALERGVASANMQRGDFGQAVREASALMEQKAQEAGVVFELHVEEGIPTVAFDPKLVRPLVLNLLDNAIKYSVKAEEKHVRVTVVRDGERVVLSVADRGVGIPPKARKGLFEPFQRGGGELTRDAPGVGIGLALVKRYADAHKARVTLTSEPGEGTTVEVRFPVG